MRQYRGKRIDNGEWIYGWYVEKGDSHYNTYPVIVYGRDFPVIPETVGQQTGLKDKNGKEIYEGDIVDAVPDSKRQYLRTIVWNDEFAQFQAPYSDGSGLQLFTKRQCLTYEVIGNIHENPELLK